MRVKGYLSYEHGHMYDKNLIKLKTTDPSVMRWCNMTSRKLDSLKGVPLNSGRKMSQALAQAHLLPHDSTRKDITFSIHPSIPSTNTPGYGDAYFPSIPLD